MRIRCLLWPRSLAGKAGVIALVFAVVLVGAYLAALHYSAKRLEEAWALGKEFGLPTDFVELLGPNVPPERNLAVPLDRATGLARTVILAARAQRTAQDDKEMEDPAFLAAMDGLLKDVEYEQAMAEADRLTEYRSPVVVVHPLYNLSLAYLQARREHLRSEQALARRLTGLGKREEATQRLLRMSRLTRRWEEKEPFLIGALVNIAMRTVLLEELNLVLRRGGPLGPSMHDEIDRELAEYETILKAIPRIGQTESIACVDSYEMLSPMGNNGFFRPLADNDRAFLIRHLHRWMKTADKQYYEAKPELDAMDKELKDLVADPVHRLIYLGTAAGLPAVNSTRGAFDRLIAKARCLRIVNAWATRNDFNAAVEKLGLPKERLIDPFDGQRLRVKPTPSGPIVYSVGPDLKDDGGKLEAPPTGGPGWDWGLGPPPTAEKK